MKANPLTAITASYRNWQAYAGNPNLSNARKLHGQRVLANVGAAKARLLSDLKRLAAMEAEIMAEMEADAAKTEVEMQTEPMLRLVSAEYVEEIKQAYADDKGLQVDMVGELEVAA